MAGVTTNNGWDYPTSTDYVKDGATAIQTLATDIDTSVGTGLLAWTSYTPTFTNLTVGNGTLLAKYNQIGKTMHMYVSLKLGSTSSVGSGITMSMPGSGQPDLYTTTNIVYEDAGVGFFVGNAVIFGSTAYLGNILTNATYGKHQGFDTTSPFTWTTNDGIYFNASYEVA
jgi:hypothetical protein